MKMTTKKYTRKDNASKWEKVKEFSEEITSLQFENITSVETRKFFKGLGGTETLNKNSLTSVSPDRLEKIVRSWK